MGREILRQRLVGRGPVVAVHMTQRQIRGHVPGNRQRQLAANGIAKARGLEYVRHMITRVPLVELGFARRVLRVSQRDHQSVG